MTSMKKINRIIEELSRRLIHSGEIRVRYRLSITAS